MIDLRRLSNNPVIKARKEIWWEKESVFNPGVINDGEKVRMLYRAVGDDLVSRFGYADSTDGLTFANFSRLPVFEPDPENEFESSGCEDPRITKIGDTFYIVYCGASLNSSSRNNAKVSPFAGKNNSWRVRVSMTTTRNFKDFERFGVIIPGIDSKDAALYPEKIGGRYFLLHRVWPDIYLASSSDLKNWQDHGAAMSPREESWDCRNIGAGTVPIKTPFGWLIIYHGVDYDLVYRLGIVVLDLKDPTKVVYRSADPIMSPETGYEKIGQVNNVVFTCGMVEREGLFYIYYGAADSCIAMAAINKSEFFEAIASQISTRRKIPVPSFMKLLGSYFNEKD